MSRRRALKTSAIVLFAAVVNLPAQAGEYFQGKTISIYAGFTSGGGVDSEMRLVAQRLGSYVAGAPSVVPLNMPGAGGLLLANHLYSIDKPDGLTIGMPGRSGFILSATSGDPSAHYKLSKFTWIGSSGAQNPILWLRSSLGVRSLDKLKTAGHPLVIGALAGTSSSAIVPRIIAKYEGLRLRIISGYTGLAEVVLAIERGELDGIYTEAGTFRPDMIAKGAVIPILQTFNIEPGLPSLETIVVNSKERALLNFVVGPSKVGAPLLGPPDLPGPVAGALRDGYLAMEKSPVFRRESTQRGIELGAPIAGAELQTYVLANLVSVTSAVLSDYNSFLGAR